MLTVSWKADRTALLMMAIPFPDVEILNLQISG